MTIPLPTTPAPGPGTPGAGPFHASEEQEQIALFQWCALAEKQRPELRLLHHIPQGGKRHIAVAKKLKAGGVRPGVPDLHLPVARGGFLGLWIELKVGKNKPTKHQEWWIKRLREEGHKVEVCYGWPDAKAVIEDYLSR